MTYHMKDKIGRIAYCKKEAPSYQILSKSAFKIFVKNFPVKTCHQCWNGYKDNPQTW